MKGPRGKSHVAQCFQEILDVDIHALQKRVRHFGQLKLTRMQRDELSALFRAALTSAQTDDATKLLTEGIWTE